MTFLRRETACAVPFSAAIEFAERFLASNPEIQLHSVAALRARVQMEHRIVLDVTDAVRSHEAIALSWRPKFSVFPEFTGFLSVRPAASGSLLALDGSYDPPFGVVGAVFDRFAGQYIAGASLSWLMKTLGENVQVLYAAYAKMRPTIAELNELDRRAHAK